MQAKISGIIICKNEEHCIENALKCLKDNVDEIIIIDDYSTDKTVDVASKYTDKIFKRHLNNDFAQQRNFGIDMSSNEWIFFLDADEIVNPIFWIELKSIIASDVFDDVKMWGAKRITYIEGKIESPYGEDINYRLFERNTVYEDAIHEHPHWQGGEHKIGIMNNNIIHQKTRERFESRKSEFELIEQVEA